MIYNFTSANFDLLFSITRSDLEETGDSKPSQAECEKLEEPKSLDIANHNELSDLITEEEASGNSDSDAS